MQVAIETISRKERQKPGGSRVSSIVPELLYSSCNTRSCRRTWKMLIEFMVILY
jgi:hypothetical protein